MGELHRGVNSFIDLELVHILHAVFEFVFEILLKVWSADIHDRCGKIIQLFIDAFSIFFDVDIFVVPNRFNHRLRIHLNLRDPAHLLKNFFIIEPDQNEDQKQEKCRKRQILAARLTNTFSLLLLFSLALGLFLLQADTLSLRFGLGGSLFLLFFDESESLCLFSRTLLFLELGCL